MAITSAFQADNAGSIPVIPSKNLTQQVLYNRIVKYADVAQLVAHHLAKVRVVSSSLIIRSTRG